jgi:hypothetical protein
MFLTLASVAASLLGIGIRWLRAIPDARAWDPNSHDKIVSHAIDLLAAGASGEKKTLLGWVLSECRRQKGDAPFFLTNMEMQVRRGAVEEDMNSSILTHYVFENPIYSFDSLEASNGGYHFYTPMREPHGLTDCSWLPYVFGQVGSGCTSPMPSALTRATAEEGCGLDPGGMSKGKFLVPLPVALGVGAFFGPVGAGIAGVATALGYWHYVLTTAYSEWHMDEEGRNYSFTDSRKYWECGYTHLAFYAIGRIAHLLSDMAVPAHVRNDSHAGTFFQGYGFDPSDPMEIYAERKDIDAIGANRKSMKDADGNHVYAFSPTRTYSTPSPVYDRGIKGDDGRNSWSRLRQDNPSDTDGLFDKLARDTYNHFYSYNTIPGNVFANIPGTLDQQLPMGKVDWTKCDVDTDAIGPMLDSFCHDAAIFLDFNFPASMSTELEAKGGRRDVAHAIGLRQQIRDHCELPGTITERILGVGPTFSPPATQWIAGILDEVAGWHEWAKALPKAAESVPITGEMGAREMDAAYQFVKRYQKLKIPLLLERLRTGSDTRKVFQDWTTDANGPAEADLREHFLVRTGEWHTQGPFCLTETIVADSYLDRQGAAMAHCAVMFTNWFESLHAGDPKKRGLATWLNKKPENPSSVPEVGSIKLLDAHASESVVLETAMVGVANHFPMPLDVTITIELLADGTDEDVFKSGVELDLEWGTLVPKIGSGFPEEDGTPDTYVRRELLAYLRKLGVDEGVLATYSRKKFDKVTLRGEGDGTQEVKLSHTIEAVVQPYNLEALARLQLPLGEWAPYGRNMGGVMREVEKVKVTGMPIPAWPDDKNGLERMTASFLNVTATVPGRKSAQPTSGDNPAGGSPPGDNPAGASPSGGNPAGGYPPGAYPAGPPV